MLSDIAKLFKDEKSGADKTLLAKVISKITDGEKVIGYKVALGDGEATIDCEHFVNANEGDIVECKRLSNGAIIVTGRKEGDAGIEEAKEDAKEAKEDAKVALEEAIVAYAKAEGIELDVNALVIFKNGCATGTTTINGDCIKTGLIDAERIDAKNLKVVGRQEGAHGYLEVNDESAGIGGMNVQVIADRLLSLSASQGIWIEGNMDSGDYDIEAKYLIAHSGIQKETGPATGGNIPAYWYQIPSGEAYAGNYALRRSGSSRAWKKDIEDIKDFDAHGLYELPVRQYRWNEEQELDDLLHVGFVAEEVGEKFPPAAVHEKIEGEDKITDWDTRPMVAGLLKLVQEQRVEIEKMKEKLEKIEAQN